METPDTSNIFFDKYYNLAQNICLLAGELNLGCCPIGGFLDKEVDKLLDIGFQKETVLYLIAVGKI